MKTAGDVGYCLETWGVSALSPLHQGGICQGLSHFCLLKVMKRNVNICTPMWGSRCLCLVPVPIPSPGQQE